MFLNTGSGGRGSSKHFKTQKELTSERSSKKQLKIPRLGTPMAVRQTGAQSRDQLNKLNKYIFNKNFICCRESRIEGPNSFYSSFYVGPFEETFSITLAHNLRRTLLSELTGLAILAVEIEGVLHRFSSLPGVKETTIDILSNLQNIVLKKSPTSTNQSLPDYQNSSIYGEFNTNRSSNIMTNQIAYLRTRGPGIVTAADIILPSGIECVNPDNHIATLAEDGVLNMQLIITEGKNAIKQKLGSSNSPYKWGLGTYPSDQASGSSLNPNNFSNNASSNKKLNPASISDQWDDTATVNSIDLNFPSEGQSGDVVSKRLNSNLIFLDSVFMPVTKVNAFVETNAKATDIVLENSSEYTNLNSKTILDLFENFQINAETKASIQVSKEDQNRRSALSQTKAPDTMTKERFVRKKPYFNFVKNNPNSINSSSNVQGVNFESRGAQTPVTGIKDSFFQLVPISSPLDENSSSIEPLNLDTLTVPKNINMDYPLETTILVNQPKNQCHIVLEIWTNGSIHPRQALESSLDFLTTTFLTLKNVKQLGSMYKSDRTYKKILKENK